MICEVNHNNQNVAPGRSDTKERATEFVRAVEFVLRPIARMLVRRGIGMSNLIELVKRAFLAGAADVVKEKGLPVTVGRLQTYTGLPRAEVERIRRTLADSVDLSETRFFKITRLFTTWHLDRRYTLQFLDTPRDLVIDDPSEPQTFHSLVRECAPGVDPKELLEELVRIGAVKIHPDTGRAHLLARAYIPEPYEVTDSERFGRMLSHYAVTLDLNSRNKGSEPRRFERHVNGDFPISEEDEAEFHEKCRQLGQKLLETLDQWLSARNKVPENGRRVGLCMFHFVETDVNSTPADGEGEPPKEEVAKNEEDDGSNVIDTLTFARGK